MPSTSPSNSFTRSSWGSTPCPLCYELVGRVRRLWKGFSGGDEAWSEIEAFFATVRRRGTAEATGEFG